MAPVTIKTSEAQLKLFCRMVRMLSLRQYCISNYGSNVVPELKRSFKIFREEQRKAKATIQKIQDFQSNILKD